MTSKITRFRGAHHTQPLVGNQNQILSDIK